MAAVTILDRMTSVFAVHSIFNYSLSNLWPTQSWYSVNLLLALLLSHPLPISVNQPIRKDFL